MILNSILFKLKVIISFIVNDIIHAFINTSKIFDDNIVKKIINFPRQL